MIIKIKKLLPNKKKLLNYGFGAGADSVVGAGADSVVGAGADSVVGAEVGEVLVEVDVEVLPEPSCIHQPPLSDIQ